jgi:hypothetical protein
VIPENEAQQLIEGLERASRRNRPFLMYALILVVAGFVSFSVYLYQDRAHERALKQQLELRQIELEGTLKGALQHAQALPTEPNSIALRNMIRQALHQTGDLEVISSQLTTEGAVRPPPPQKAAPQLAAARPRPAQLETAVPSPEEEQVPTAIRLIIHISDPQQRGAAAQLALGLTRLGERSIQTEIRQVSRAQDNSLRCLRQAECALADELAALVNSRLRSPAIRKRDFTIYHLNLRNTPLGTYELWFRPGPIELRALGE